ncbi:MAG: transporter substrate-binding domain-containing protein [Proteobacteria bacterium]|nr:transporter substrate-binding domain-containing protein [Pseudomonadota bacterium]
MGNKKYTILLTLLVALILLPAVLIAKTYEGSPYPPGKKLVVGVLHDPPYLIKEDSGEWTGMTVDIWKIIAQSLKVDYEFKEMKFHELLDALRENKIDISIEAFYVTAEREQFMDYTFAFGSTRLALATLPEKAHHLWWEAIAIFFSWGTLKILISLGLILCILGFLFWLIERRENPDYFGGSAIKGIGSGIYWVGSTLASGVCFGVTLKSLTARILGIAWMFSCTIALSALIASLASTLTINSSMVNSVSEESLQHMHLGGVKGSAESVPLKAIGGKYTLYLDEDEMMDALIKRKIEGVLYDEITLNYFKYNTYKDRISTYPTNFRRFQFAFGLPKDSPYRAKINYALVSLIEKPDWPFLLKRYGLGENFEEKAVTTKKRRRG